MNKQIFDIVLLVALPASGKSEVRKYLHSIPPEKCVSDFHMGPNVQLDDYPYVHLMRRIDEELKAINQEYIFFNSPLNPFKNPLDWGTLIHLINEDYANVVNKKILPTSATARLILERIDAAGSKAGIKPRLTTLNAEVLDKISHKLEKETKELVENLNKLNKEDLKGKTVVIEFARGGPEGSTMPLSHGFGYYYSLSQLSEQILNKAVILYIWVTPEESRRKNEERAKPNEQGSILHHGVPHDVMINDYGCDDLVWLENNSEEPGTVTVKAHNQTYHIPVGKFDNRIDKTSFIREDESAWKKEDVAAVHNGIKAATDRLAELIF